MRVAIGCVTLRLDALRMVVDVREIMCFVAICKRSEGGTSIERPVALVELVELAERDNVAEGAALDTESEAAAGCDE
jgi:hypothetical protein